MSTNSRSLRALLVDDEISALKILRGMLTAYCPEVQILGEAMSAHEAVLAVSAVKPEVVFLDIEMPPFGTGFDFLKQCQPVNFGVIFTTAYSQYAVDAINAVSPWFYLVKPYSVTSIQAAVQVALEKTAFTAPPPIVEEETAGLVIKDTRRGQFVLRFKEILYCEADGGTCDVYILRKEKVEKVLVFRTLKDIESQMPPGRYFRIHHGILVNMAYVERYMRTGRNGSVFLTSGHELKISVQRMEEFDKAFSRFLRQQ